MKNYISLLIAVILIAVLLGCHAGGNGPFAPNNGETTVLPETRTVGANGRFTDITFPSGAVIKCPNDNTFKEGVKVTAIEQKVPVLTDNSGTFSYVYIYAITAVLPTSNSLVNTVEKPLSITLPNENPAGICYIGTRSDESDPWHYSLVTDGTTSNVRFMRLSANPPKSCSFDLYRLNIQFRLFLFNNEGNKGEVLVDTITLTPADDVEIKDGKYIGKLSVKLNVEGENLNGIKAENLIAKIIYRSKKQQGANIDFAINKIDLSDKAVTGNYEHSFEITNIKIDNSLGNTAELSFELSLDGISLEEFPTSFLVEFYSKGSDENTRPFEYTKIFSFETKENQDNPDNPDPQPVTTYTITYDLDGGEQTEGNPENYTVETESFTLNNPTKTGYTFTGWTGSNGNTPQTTVEIAKGTTGNLSYKANWKQNAPDEYTLNLIKGDGIATVTGDGTYKKGESVTASCTMLNGYEFDKWTGDFITETFTMPANDVTMTANAKPVQYKITLDSKGGTIEKNTIEYNIETEEFDLPKPNKTGYDFTGWTGSNGETPERIVKIEKGTTGDKNYTANYSAVAFTITYTLGADEVINDNPTGFNPDTETFTLNEPTRTGYTFTGWTGSNGNTPQKEVTIAKGTTEKKSYTANWSINSYNLTINKGTGINTISGAGNYKYNSSVTASCTMLAGYEFDSWTGDFTSETFNMPANNATMTANAKLITYSIAYNLGDGALAQGVINPTTYDVTSATITLNEPTREGYTFTGWTGSNGTTPEKPLTINSGSYENKSYTANWSINSYNLTLNKGTGINSVTGAGNYEYNSSVTASCTMLAGYEFDKWTGDFTTETFVIPAKDVTMTANAKVITYNIAYDLAGGALANGVTNPTTFDVNTADFTLNEPTKNGYEFAGWTYEGQNTPTTSVTIAKGSTGTKEFTAHFNLLLTLKIASDTGAVFAPATDNIYKIRPTFTITPTVAEGVVMTDTEKANILSALSIKDSGDNAISSVSKSWNNGKIALSFTENLSFNTTYTISFGNIDAVNLTCSPLSFKTINIEGSGTEVDPYLVKTPQHLDLVRDLTSCYFKQYNDISLEGVNWIPIGNNNNEFSGNYDGNNKTISNLSISFENTNNEQYNNGNVGLFGYNSGSISNLSIDSADININNASTLKIGCVLGRNNFGTIENCNVKNSAISVSNSGNIDVGGICGFSYLASNGKGNITGCNLKNTTISCSTNGNYSAEVGGICGWAGYNVDISKCSVVNDSGSHKISGSSNYLSEVGGICGNTSGSITSCYVKDYEIEATSNGSNNNVGGICGIQINDIILSSCYFYGGSISGNGDIGYLIGDKRNVKDSFTSLSGNGINLFGFDSGGNIINCYDGVGDSTTFSGKTWSDGAWSDYNTDVFPPTLKQN